MIKRVILFLVLNFAALAIGSRFTSRGGTSIWYQNLNKAPWTPPGWMFGTAWTLIMICFAFYMAYLLSNHVKKNIKIIVFSIQWFLNISWNPIFFYMQNILGGLISISFLTIIISYLFFGFSNEMRIKTTLLVPYLIWLLIATSLNIYILIYN